nr:cell polarity protein,leucine rich repeat [Hymenolepis microstoma]
MFKCFPFIKGCGSQIDTIEKSHASLTSVPDDVLRSYRTLEECKLDANQIKELPSAFFRLEKIRILSMSDNELTRIPPAIGNFSNLVELDISRNDINELPTSLRLCDSLQILDASNNALKTLPDGFSQLRSLRILSLNDVSLYELPADFGGLKKLQKLELRDNYLNSLPNTFGELSSLEFLDLGGNDFVTISASIGNLHNLLELWLDDNQMTSLPDEIGNLHSLTQMDVSENRLTALPSTISGLTSLSDLNLTQNYLDALPDEIGQLVNLTVFKLNRNQLVDLTSSIGKCQNLLEFYLTENYLSTLPSTIGNLTKMFHFNVTKNQLAELPPEIGECVSLEILSLRDNNLQRIPSEIGNLTQLHVLDVAGNRLDRLPVSLTSCPLKALWLVQSQAQPISLQRAVDDITGEEYLTCYLLPQETDGKEVLSNGFPQTNGSSPGAILDQPKNNFESTTNGIHFPSTQMPSGSSSIVNLEDSSDEADTGRETTARVRFNAEDGPAKNATDVREYPKTRHPMHLKKGLDGDNVHKTNDNSPYVPSNVHDLHPNADQNTSHNASVPLYIKKQDTPKRALGGVGSATDTSSLYTNTQGSDYAGSLSSDLTSPISPTSSAGIDDLISSNVSTSNSGRGRHNGNDSGGPGVAFAESPLEGPGSHASRAERVKDEEQEYSSGGEEIDTITKSVAFGDDVKDNEDNGNQKLIRRDTPHYTKRARIHMNNEEAVIKLLKKCCDPNVVNSFAEGIAPDSTKSTDALLTGGSKNAQATHTTTTNATPSNTSPSLLAQSGTNVQQTLVSQSTSPPKTEQVTLHITLEREPGGGLGLSIAGGVGSVPFRGLDQGIFVSRLAPGGLAETSGLKVGDKLLEVNGVSMVNVEHQVAVSALRTDATRFKLLLCREVPVVTHAPPQLSHTLNVESTNDDRSAKPFPLQPTYLADPQRAHNLPSSLLNTTSLGRVIPSSTLPFAQAAPTAMQLIKCTLHRDWSGLGFSIAGGRGVLGPQADASTIYISRIVEGGAADKTGQLRVGDQLYKINGIDVRNARHDQVITLLTGAGPNVELEVLRKLIASQVVNSDSTPTSPIMNSVESNETGRNLTHSPSLTSDGPQFLRKEAGLDVYRVNLKHRPGKNLGLRICGGCDSSSLPFGGETPGVFICRVQEGGEAQEAGLRVGDRLLSVNGRDLRRVNHDEAVSALMPSGLSEESLLLEVRRDPLPPGLRELVIPCPDDEPLGLSLLSRRSMLPSPIIPTTPGNTDKESEDGKEGIFVRQIAPSSPIARDGKLKPGDQILVANSEWLMSLEPQEIVDVVQPQEGKLLLTICDGIDPSSLIEKVSSHRQPTFSNISCQIIDCNGSESDHAQSIKTSYLGHIEHVHAMVEKSPGECVHTLVIRKCIPHSHHFNSPQATESVCTPNPSNNTTGQPSTKFTSNLSDAYPELIDFKTIDVRVMSRPKKVISRLVRERMRCWQADRDRAEGVNLRLPRFPVLANTKSSKISDRTSTPSEMPLEPCDVDEYSWKRASQDLKTNSSRDKAKIVPMIPVVGQLVEPQRSPALAEPITSETKEPNQVELSSLIECASLKWLTNTSTTTSTLISARSLLPFSFLAFEVSAYFSHITSPCD